MIVEQSRDCNPRLSASKIHALFHSTTQNSKAHSSVAVTSLSVQFSRSVVSESLRPHGLQHARTPYPSPTPGDYSVMSIESVMPSSHFILCLSLLLPPSVFPSIRVFSNESVLPIMWPKYWSFSFNIRPSKEYSVEYLLNLLN